MRTFENRLSENLDIWFDNKLILTKKDFLMLRKFTYLTEVKK